MANNPDTLVDRLEETACNIRADGDPAYVRLRELLREASRRIEELEEKVKHYG